MSFWANNPELYDEIIFKQMCAEGLAKEEDLEERDMGDIVDEFMQKPESFKTAMRAEQEYWGSRIDDAMNRKEEETCRKKS